MKFEGESGEDEESKMTELLHAAPSRQSPPPPYQMRIRLRLVPRQEQQLLTAEQRQRTAREGVRTFFAPLPALELDKILLRMIFPGNVLEAKPHH